MNILVLSDIHGNLTALEAVLEKANNLCKVEGLIILGDLIDYGMGSNEVIKKVQSIQMTILCNIWGNHEYAICNQNFSRFSSNRGVESAQNTLKNLVECSKDYLENEMQREGYHEFIIGDKYCLGVHGSIHNPFWKSISTDKLSERIEYSKYDYVFSGHSHIPMYFDAFYYHDNENTRNKKKTIFLNPGSVGQPRNLNPLAQFLIVNTGTEEIRFCTVPYDIEKEQKLFTDEVSAFYKKRLTWGV